MKLAILALYTLTFAALAAAIAAALYTLTFPAVNLVGYVRIGNPIAAPFAFGTFAAAFLLAVAASIAAFTLEIRRP